MNGNLSELIDKELARGTSTEEIYKKFVTYGWEADEIIHQLSLKKNKKTTRHGFVLALVITAIFVILGVGIYSLRLLQTSNLPVQTINPVLIENNEIIFDKIEKEETILHEILHRDLEKGQIPISKEIAIVFRLTDLLHQQNEALLLTEKIDQLRNQRVVYTEKQRIDINNEIKAKQEEILADLADVTHDGTIQQEWLDEVTEFRFKH